MHPVVGLSLLLLSSCGQSLAHTCGVTDFLEQLIQSVHRIQSSGSACQRASETRIGKAGPIGAPGPRGPPGQIDMDAIKQFVEELIDKNLMSRIGFGELCYMGMKSHLIPNSAISASTVAGVNHESYRGRLDNQAKSGNVGAWAAGINAVGQWIQVDFGSVKEIAGVITQGRSLAHNQWVRSYKVSCANDSRQWWTIVQENGRDKVFQANDDMETKVYNRLPEVISCRFIRIYPQSWHNYVSMRVEFVPGACFNQLPPFTIKSR